MTVNKFVINVTIVALVVSLSACANYPSNVSSGNSTQDKNMVATTAPDVVEQAVTCPSDAPPAMMIVEGTNEKPEQFGEYTKALIEAKLYPALQGYYAAIGDPADVFEGAWPEKKFAVIARFPCLARAQQFWSSDTYEKIKPLRKGAGEVRVIVFEELPTPEYIKWND